MFNTFYSFYLKILVGYEMIEIGHGPIQHIQRK